MSFTVQIHWQRCFSVEKVNQTALLALLTQHTRPSGRTGQSYVEFVRNLIQQQQQQHCQRNILEEEKGRDGEFLVSKFNMLKRGLEPLLAVYQRVVLYGMSTYNTRSIRVVGIDLG